MLFGQISAENGVWLFSALFFFFALSAQNIIAKNFVYLK